MNSIEFRKNNFTNDNIDLSYEHDELLSNMSQLDDKDISNNEISFKEFSETSSIIPNYNEEISFEIFKKIFNYRIFQTITENDNELIGENTKESNNNSDSRQKFVTILSRKRGRKSISQNTKIHQSTDYDNTLSKIQCHYLTFIINLSNDILKSLNLPYDFKQIDYNIKKKVNHPFFCKLRDYSIRNILELDISPKFSTYDKDINKKTLDELSKLSDFRLDTFFKMNYLDLFKNYYFKIDNPLSKIPLIGEEIKLSSKTKVFYDLLKKNENSENNLKQVAISAYFDGDFHFGQKMKFTSTKNNN